MSRDIACSCGYSGPAVTEGESTLCPLCRTPAAAVEKSYRIPCPNGHVLKARESWLGREMVCPQCNEPFVLQASRSLEHRRVQEKRQAEADARQASIWINRAIIAGVIIGLSFVAMIVASLNPQWFEPGK